MKKPDENIRHLLSLLDDENQQVASLAMAELLKFDDIIDPFLGELQESGNSRLRKRIHQLQSVLSFRRRRIDFSKNLKNKNLDLITGLFELHFQWYDNDAEADVRKLWDKLIDSSRKFSPDTIEKLAYFMRKFNFTVAERDNLDPDYFCIGIVLEELIGSDFILCAIAMEVAAHWNLKLQVIQIVGDFALLDPNGKVLLPGNGWRLLPQEKKGYSKKWNNTMLLKLTSSMLFLAAVSTSSFRYINTIGHCLARISGKDELDFLPYPYNS